MANRSNTQMNIAIDLRYVGNHDFKTMLWNGYAFRYLFQESAMVMDWREVENR